MQAQIPPEVQKRYMTLKNDYNTIFKTVVNMEDEKREHMLVLEAIKDLEPERKCWRSVGGVLVERTIGEIIPALQDRVENQLSNKLTAYNEKLSVKQKELHALETQLGIVKKKEEAKDNEDGNKGNVGVLA